MTFWKGLSAVEEESDGRMGLSKSGAVCNCFFLVATGEFLCAICPVVKMIVYRINCSSQIFLLKGSHGSPNHATSPSAVASRQRTMGQDVLKIVITGSCSMMCPLISFVDC